MANAFVDSHIRSLIKRAKRLVNKVEKNFNDYNQGEFDDLHNDILRYVLKNTDNLVENFIEIELERKRGIRDQPRIFIQLGERSKQEWDQTLRRAFAVAKDSAVEAENSIFARVGRETLILRKYYGDYSGRPFNNLKQLPGFSVSKQFTTGGVVLRFYSKGSLLGQAEIVDPAPGNPYNVLTGIRIEPEYQGLGLIQAIVKWVRGQYKTVRVLTPPPSQGRGVMIESQQILFLRRNNWVIRPTGKGLILYTANLPDYNDKSLLEAPRRLFGFIRARTDFRGKWVQGFVSYISLLFRTIPRNLERDLMAFAIRLYDPEELFHIAGGIVHNSAKVCEWCNEKVLDRESLDFVVRTPQLSVHLFHPNCRHVVRSVPFNYRGRVYRLVDTHGAFRRGLLGKVK